MLLALAALTTLGLGLGLLLGTAARLLKVEAEPITAEIEALLPGSQCGQCGFPGCAGAAVALAEGKAKVTLCPPGGREVAQQLAALLGVSVDLSGMSDSGPQIAQVDESICIGCTRCFKVCPTDAIVGAVKQIHSVIRDACTGCANCVNACPTESLHLIPIPVTPQTWAWPKPAHTPVLAKPVLADAGCH